MDSRTTTFRLPLAADLLLAALLLTVSSAVLADLFQPQPGFYILVSALGLLPAPAFGATGQPTLILAGPTGSLSPAGCW